MVPHSSLRHIAVSTSRNTTVWFLPANGSPPRSDKAPFLPYETQQFDLYHPMAPHSSLRHIAVSPSRNTTVWFLPSHGSPSSIQHSTVSTSRNTTVWFLPTNGSPSSLRHSALSPSHTYYWPVLGRSSPFTDCFSTRTRPFPVTLLPIGSVYFRARPFPL